MADILVLRAKDGESGPKAPLAPLTGLHSEESRQTTGRLLQRISTIAKDVTSKIIPVGLAPTAAERKAAHIYSERKLILEARMEEVSWWFFPQPWLSLIPC